MLVAEVDQCHTVGPNRRGSPWRLRRKSRGNGIDGLLEFVGKYEVVTVRREILTQLRRELETTLLRPQKQLRGTQCARCQDEDRRLDTPACTRLRQILH
jgi:hypothetical protein